MYKIFKRKISRIISEALKADKIVRNESLSLSPPPSLSLSILTSATSEQL